MGKGKEDERDVNKSGIRRLTSSGQKSTTVNSGWRGWRGRHWGEGRQRCLFFCFVFVLFCLLVLFCFVLFFWGAGVYLSSLG